MSMSTESIIISCLLVLILITLWVKRDKTNDISILHQKFLQGDAEAAFQLASVYNEGKLVQQDTHTAAVFMMLAAQRGQVQARMHFVQLFEMLNEGLKLVQTSEQIKSEVLYTMGLLCAEGCIDAPNYEKAREYYEQAAKFNNPYAQCCLGVMYETGTGVEQNYQQAIKLYKDASDQGNAEGQFRLGCMYLEGKGVEHDDNQALELFYASSDKSHPAALRYLGFMYFEGRCVSKDYNVAFNYFKKAADLGDDNALCDIGYMYSRGIVVPLDYDEAEHFYRQAISKGNSRALINLIILNKENSSTQP